MSANCTEDAAHSHLRRLSPLIDCILDPDRYGDGSDVTSLASQVYDGPMSLPDLQILDSKSRELGSAQSAAYEHGNHCEIADTAKIVPVGFLQ